MPADYKSYTRKKKRRNAKKNEKRRLLWIIGIVILILLGAVFYWLSKNDSIKIPIKKIAHKSAVAAKTVKKEIKKKLEQPEIKFEFYNLLPKEKVTVPGNPNPTVAVSKNNTPAINNSHYLLQVASLKKFSDADSMKANLIMKGFSAQVKKIDVKGNTWFRVQIGPFISMDNALDTQNKLRKDNQDAIIRKIKT